MSFATLFIASQALSAASTYAQGQAQAQAYEASAKAAEQQARAQRERGAYQAKLTRDKGQSLLSTQRARYGASGVAMTGTPLDVALGTVKDVEMDALMARYNAEVDARRSEGQAAIYRSQADAASKAGTIGAVGTLLTGAASLGMIQPAKLAGGTAMAPAGEPDPFRWRIPGWD